MRLSRRGRVAGFLAAGLALAATVLGAAVPAQANPTSEQPARISWSYTDSRSPVTSHTDPTSDVPLGAWQDGDGKTHLSRVYASWDLTGLAGKHILDAQLYAQESQAADCPDRQVQVWRTADRPEQPTWVDPPRELSLLGTIGGTTICPAYLTIDLAGAIADAVAAGEHRFSVELRVPCDQEADLSLGRWLDSRYGVGLTVTDNRVPAVPTQLTNGNQPCATAAPYPSLTSNTLSGLRLDTVVSDPDQADYQVTGEFAVWPVDDPNQRTTYTDKSGNGLHAWVTLLPSALTDGASYGWQVRVTDGTDTSAWSETCYFTVDMTRPSAPPVVTSPDFPPDQFVDGGTPGRFTFDANGVPDVAAYEYQWQIGGTVEVPADGLGGSATVTLSPPWSASNTLSVNSVDRAGNWSATTSYRILVGDTSPVVTTDATVPYGQPFTVRFAPGPHVTGVTGYTYQVNGADPVTVPAEPDGTAATSVTLTLHYGNQLTVRSHSANGWVSPAQLWRATEDDTPLIGSATYPPGQEAGGIGVPGTFTFSDWVPGAVSYEYSFDWADDTEAPATDGTASVTWTPTSDGGHYLDVYAVFPDGRTSLTGSYYFEVAAS